MPSNSARKPRLTPAQEREWDHWENREYLVALYIKNVARTACLNKMEEALYDEIEGFYEAIRQTIAEGDDNPLTRKFREWSEAYVKRGDEDEDGIKVSVKEQIEKERFGHETD